MAGWECEGECGLEGRGDDAMVLGGVFTLMYTERVGVRSCRKAIVEKGCL